MSYSLFKAHWNKIVGNSPPKSQCIDNDLPFGLRLGGLVTIDPTYYILGDGNLLCHHFNGTMVIKAISKAKLANGTNCITAYLDAGKNANGEENVVAIIANEKADKSGYEMLVMDQLAEVIPPNDEEWGIWLNPESGLIGNIDSFTPTGEKYDRLIKGEYHIPPLEHTEVIYFDKAGVNKLVVKMSYMLYARDIPDAQCSEFLLMRLEECREEAFIRVLVGLQLNPGMVTIL